MVNLAKFLEDESVDAGLASILGDLASSFVKIGDELRSGKEGKVGTQNVSGDEQIAMDVFANDELIDNLKVNVHCGLVASEELDEPLEYAHENEGFSVVFDPLDGSSIADMNLTVGTIVGIYKGTELLGRTGREQVAALIAVYGTRLTFLLTTGSGVHEFLYVPKDREFVLLHKGLKVEDSGKIMAPGNLRVAATDPWYFDFVKELIMSEYTLRYSGGMVPDINQIIKKSGGIFSYPAGKKQPEGKLRLLYECAPMAFLMEQAGGAASVGATDVLDLKIEQFHQRTPIFIGSKKEVQLALNYWQKGR